MSGETKKRISDLEIELNEERKKNKLLLVLVADRPTLRDQFAMAALTGIIARSATYFDENGFNSFAVFAYQIADAMSRVRDDG